MLFTLVIEDGGKHMLSQINSASLNGLIFEWTQSSDFNEFELRSCSKGDFLSEEDVFEEPVELKNSTNAWFQSILVNDQSIGFTIIQNPSIRRISHNANLRCFSYCSLIDQSTFVSQFTARTAKDADDMWICSPKPWLSNLSSEAFLDQKNEARTNLIKFGDVPGKVGVSVTTIHNENEMGIAYRILTSA